MCESEPDAFGLLWLTSSSYKRFLEICVDRDRLPESFAEYEKKGVELIREFQKQGRHIEKIMVDPDDLLAWCERQGCEVDADARELFAAFSVADIYRRRN